MSENNKPTESKGFFQGVKDAGKKAGNWFMHEGEALTKIAEEKKTPLKDLSFFNRLNKTKAIGVGVGALILGSVVASIGNAGPGKHAEQEMAREQQAPDAGMAKA